MTMQQPKSTTRFSTPIVSELAEQSTKAKPVIKPKKKKTKKWPNSRPKAMKAVKHEITRMHATYQLIYPEDLQFL